VALTQEEIPGQLLQARAGAQAGLFEGELNLLKEILS
jgi:hypothetical protein